GVIDKAREITVGRETFTGHAAEGQAVVLRPKHELGGRQAPGRDHQHVGGDFLLAALVADAQPESVVLDLPAARNLLKAPDLGKAAKLDGRLGVLGVEEALDDRLVERVARAWETAQKTPSLTFAVSLLVETGLLGVRVFDDGEIQRRPFMDDL